MKTFLLEIITPERRVFSEEVRAISVPTIHGIIGILPNHTPIFTALDEGEVKIETKDKEYYLAIGGGFMEVGKARTSILVSRAYHARELNEKNILQAQAAAKEALAKKAKGMERAQALAILRRSSLEMKILRRKRIRKEQPVLSTH